MQAYLLGTFLERGNGFHFGDSPPANIRDSKYLRSQDLSEALACVLANLQEGNFDVAEVPVRLIQSRDETGLWLASTHLLGYAAPMNIVRTFVESVGAVISDMRQFYVLNAAMASGGMWSVQRILAAHGQVNDADVRRFLEFCLSWLLEREPGSIWMGPELVEMTDSNLPPFEEPERQVDFKGYEDTVRSQDSLLRQKAKLDDQSVIAEGEVLDVQKVASRLLERLRQGEPGDRIEKGRMLFEAITGIDCRGFFNEDGILQPLAAASIVEDFLDSGEASKYESGVRYFFGHRIPD